MLKNGVQPCLWRPGWTHTGLFSHPSQPLTPSTAASVSPKCVCELGEFLCLGSTCIDPQTCLWDGPDLPGYPHASGPALALTAASQSRVFLSSGPACSSSASLCRSLVTGQHSQPLPPPCTHTYAVMSRAATCLLGLEGTLV